MATAQKEPTEVIWPKKHRYIVRGKVTFTVTIVAVDHREALDYAADIIDGLQKELAGYYSVNSINEWEVNAENVRSK